jgi:hypothetical protein
MGDSVRMERFLPCGGSSTLWLELGLGDTDSRIGSLSVHIRSTIDGETPAGEWDGMEVFCKGTSIVGAFHFVKMMQTLYGVELQSIVVELLKAEGVTWETHCFPSL